VMHVAIVHINLIEGRHFFQLHVLFCFGTSCFTYFPLVQLLQMSFVIVKIGILATFPLEKKFKTS
jgi:hypothetical protein